MARFFRLLRKLFLLGLILAALGAIAVAGIYFYLEPRLPDVQILKDVQLQVPLSVYTKDRKLIAQFGETRRYPVDIGKVPLQVKQAFIASEDARFYEHKGVDYKGIGRAVWLTLTTDGKRVPGGSTITQQVARNYFELTRDVDYGRKIKEIMLALKMEQELEKDVILSLYLNKIFFGNRSYGIAAAAEYYYGKKLEQLTLAETAVLAGLPKAPSTNNPISNPKRAIERRGYVLSQMLKEKYITQAQFDEANAAPNTASRHEPKVEMNAPYLAEMVRLSMIERYADDALISGFQVYTTVNSVDQINAENAVRRGLLAYDRRHGWRGVESHIDLPADADAAFLKEKARSVKIIPEFPAAIVSGFSGNSATVVLFSGKEYALSAADSRWTGRSPSSLLKRGDIIRLLPDDKKVDTYSLAQLPKAQAALVSLVPEDGSLKAIVGGFSFYQNSFNRATQAKRQPGSSFKPFVYAAAFERGYTPASIVNDAPIELRSGGGKVWRPQNDGGGFAGPIRVREALVQSRNLVSVRLLSAIGTDFARNYISQFGFSKEELPPNLSMSLGTADLTPMSVARGYAVFANGGYLVTPYFIEKIIDRNGNAVTMTRPLTACRACSQRIALDERTAVVVDGFDFSAGGPQKNTAAAVQDDDPNRAGPTEIALAPRAIDERTAFLISSLMKDVVKRGTATEAKKMGREDIGGKTGSTNDHRDAWFSGFGGKFVTTVWVGKDDFKPLGRGEYGGRAALPIWIDFMQTSLKGLPENDMSPPNGVVTASISASGNLMPEGAGGLTEYFKQEDYDRLTTSGYNWEVPGGEKTNFEDIF
jgi:penicillin-binding protein 1A